LKEACVGKKVPVCGLINNKLKTNQSQIKIKDEVIDKEKEITSKDTIRIITIRLQAKKNSITNNTIWLQAKKE
jgi:hypothetical protein